MEICNAGDHSIRLLVLFIFRSEIHNGFQPGVCELLHIRLRES